MQEIIDNYIPYGPEFVKFVSKLRKAKIIEMLSKKGVECLKLKEEAARYAVEGGWIRLEGVVRVMPDCNCWLCTKDGDIFFSPEGEFVPLSKYEYYLPINKPEPPLATTTG